MRTPVRTIPAVTTILILIAATVAAQTDWTRDPLVPVLPAGEAGAWDDELAGATTVMLHEGIYKTWYEGNAGFGYATSSDGIVWTKHAGNPILEPGDVGAWDAAAINHPSVVFVEGLYRMWYSGVDAQNDNRIGHATSPDGIDWTRYGTEPVLDLGPPGSLDEQEVIHPMTLHENGLYRMWYNGVDDTAQRILYAESPDGIEWTRYTDHPMLEPGAAGSWDDDSLGPLCVLPHAGRYLMWYTGWNHVPEFRIGLASSPDGIEWTKSSAHNPVLSPGAPGGWDGDLVAIPNVRHEDDHFRMWYGGGGAVYQTGHATAPDVTAIGAHPRPPMRFALHGNRPNPFNPSTRIEFVLQRRSHVRLSVFNVAGRRVAMLVDEPRGAGTHAVSWTAGGVASGVYYCRIEADDWTATRSMVLAK